MASRFEEGQPARRPEWAPDIPSVDVVEVDVPSKGYMRVRERAGGIVSTVKQSDYRPVDGRFLPHDHPDFTPSPIEAMRIRGELEDQEREVQRQETYKQQYGLLSVTPTLFSIIGKSATLGHEVICWESRAREDIGNYLRYAPVVIAGQVKFKRKDALRVLKRLLEGRSVDEIEAELWPNYEPKPADEG
jgi:hypothetical protein